MRGTVYIVAINGSIKTNEYTSKFISHIKNAVTAIKATIQPSTDNSLWKHKKNGWHNDKTLTEKQPKALANHCRIRFSCEPLFLFQAKESKWILLLGYLLSLATFTSESKTRPTNIKIDLCYTCNTQHIWRDSFVSAKKKEKFGKTFRFLTVFTVSLFN